jgi:hypothetical protein
VYVVVVVLLFFSFFFFHYVVCVCVVFLAKLLSQSAINQPLINNFDELWK